MILSLLYLQILLAPVMMFYLFAALVVVALLFRVIKQRLSQLPALFSEEFWEFLAGSDSYDGGMMTSECLTPLLGYDQTNYYMKV